MNKIAQAWIAAVLSATSATAQENLDILSPEMPHEVVVYEDDSLQIIAPLSALDAANNFTLMCPGYPMRELYSEHPRQAVMLIYNTSRLLASVALENYRAAQKDFAGPDDTYPAINSGFIHTDATLVLTYTFNEYVAALGDFVNGPDPFPAAPLADPALFRSLRRHADNFCFSNF